jgi:hypothetical protein
MVEIPRRVLPSLRDAIVDAYSKGDLVAKVLEFDVDFANVVPGNLPFGDQVVELLLHFRRKDMLGNFLDALAEGRQERPEFKARLLRIVGDPPPERPDVGASSQAFVANTARWLVAGGTLLAAAAALWWLLPHDCREPSVYKNLSWEEMISCELKYRK